MSRRKQIALYSRVFVVTEFVVSKTKCKRHYWNIVPTFLIVKEKSPPKKWPDRRKFYCLLQSMKWGHYRGGKSEIMYSAVIKIIPRPLILCAHTDSITLHWNRSLIHVKMLKEASFFHQWNLKIHNLALNYRIHDIFFSCFIFGVGGMGCT